MKHHRDRERLIGGRRCNIIVNILVPRKFAPFICILSHLRAGFKWASFAERKNKLNRKKCLTHFSIKKFISISFMERIEKKKMFKLNLELAN